MKKKWLVVPVVVLAVFGLLAGCSTDNNDDPNPGKTPSDFDYPPDTATHRIVGLGDPTVENSATQRGWASNGYDDNETDLDPADLIGAEFLVLELSKGLQGGMQFIWQGEGETEEAIDRTAWNQNNITDDNGGPIAGRGLTITINDSGRVVLTFNLSEACNSTNDRLSYTDFQKATGGKIFIAYYSSNYDSLGVQLAYLMVPK